VNIVAPKSLFVVRADGFVVPAGKSKQVVKLTNPPVSAHRSFLDIGEFAKTCD
jgi:hypothetical protein